MAKGKKLYHFADYDLITDDIEVHIPGDLLADRVQAGHEKLQEVIMTSIATLMPKDTGDFIRRTEKSTMSMLGTEEMSLADKPFGRYLYHGKVMVADDTGMDPARIPNYGRRFREGAILRVTNRPLNLKHGNPDAVPEWYDEAKARYLPQWIAAVERAMNGG